MNIIHNARTKKVLVVEARTLCGNTYNVKPGSEFFGHEVTRLVETTEKVDKSIPTFANATEMGLITGSEVETVKVLISGWRWDDLADVVLATIVIGNRVNTLIFNNETLDAIAGIKKAVYRD